MDQVRAAAGQIWTRRLRGRDAITCRRRTHEKHETCGKRKVNTLPKLFSLFCICWTAETAEAPPCNPEPPGPESSCLQADWNQALLEVEQSSTATREEWKDGGTPTNKTQAKEPERAVCCRRASHGVWEHVYGRPELYVQGDAGSEWQDDKEMLPVHGAATIQSYWPPNTAAPAARCFANQRFDVRPGFVHTERKGGRFPHSAPPPSLWTSAFTHTVYSLFQFHWHTIVKLKLI